MKNTFLYLFLTLALLSGCSDDKKAEESTSSIKKEVKETNVKVDKTPEEKLIDQVKDSSVIVAKSLKEAGSEVVSKISEETKEIAKVGSKAVESVSQKVLEKTQIVTNDVVSKANETKDKIEQSINNIVATKKSTGEINKKGKALYLKCAGCHGQNGEKEALGKSKIIKGWNKSNVVQVLQGYKDGSYGRVMKGVMKSQVINLSDEEIDALGAYISTF